MLPLAKASTGLIGTISSNTLESGGAEIFLACKPSTEIVKPRPGSIMLAKNNPIATAIALVTMKTKMVLAAIEPIRAAEPKPAEPAIRVARTKGTTTIRINRMNNVPKGCK